MKKLFYKLAHPFRVAYWFVVRPNTYGVKCLIEHAGNFLFIRNSYGHQLWTFPGGGVHRGETPEQTVIRETLEEVGINIKSPQFLGTFSSDRQYKHDMVYCFYTKVNSDFFRIDNEEVSAAAWFPKTKLPGAFSSSVKVVLSLFETRN